VVQHEVVAGTVARPKRGPGESPFVRETARRQEAPRFLQPARILVDGMNRTPLPGFARVIAQHERAEPAAEIEHGCGLHEDAQSAQQGGSLERDGPFGGGYAARVTLVRGGEMPPAGGRGLVYGGERRKARGEARKVFRFDARGPAFLE